MENRLIVLPMNEKCIYESNNAHLHLWHSKTISLTNIFNVNENLQLENVNSSTIECDPYFMADEHHISRHHNYKVTNLSTK